MGLFLGTLIALFLLGTCGYLYLARRRLQDLLYFTYHELRTDLTVIHGYGELLQESNLGVQEKENGLQTLLKATSNIDKTLNALQRVVRGVVEKEKVALPDLVSKMVEETTSVHLDREIKLRYDEGMGAIEVDPYLFKIALLNLINNALKYSPKGTPVEVILSNSPIYQTVEVRDCGRGIGRKSLKQIFRRLYSLSPNQGMGVGLYLVRKIADLHKGKIVVESILTKGSVFTLVFRKEE